MSNENRPGRVGRSIGAVLAGLLAIVLITTITDMALHVTGVFPPPGQPMANVLWLLAIAYRVVYGILGCYITARLAPSEPMRHALILGAIGLAVSTSDTIATWNRGQGFGPRWYPLTLVAITMPCAWIAGRLATAPAPADASSRPPRS